MTTATETSQAQQAFDRYQAHLESGGPPLLGALPAGSTVSYPNGGGVSYFGDNSILLCVHYKPYRVLDGERTYYRDTVEHAARCLNLFTKERRAEMVQHSHPGEESVWIDGVLWSSDGELLDV